MFEEKALSKIVAEMLIIRNVTDFRLERLSINMRKIVQNLMIMFLALISCSLTVRAEQCSEVVVSKNVVSQESIYSENGKLIANNVVQYLDTVRPEWAEKKENTDENTVEWWRQLIAEGNVTIEKGKIIVLEDSDIEDEMINTIDMWNYAIDIGLLAINQETFDFYTPEITDAVINSIDAPMERLNYLAPTMRASHGCGYPVWYVEVTALNNYNTIKTFYNKLYQASLISSGVDPWMSTATYWVSLVRENGAWDYKSNKNYMGRYYCCAYGGKVNQDHYIEWIGNYNYGYTGKFLFSLNMLHTGSYVVSGFDPKDETTDWPAIDEGYYDAP